MPKLDSVQFTQALTEEWEETLVKEAFVGALGRGVSRTFSRISGPTGQLAGKLPGARAVGDYVRNPVTKELWKGRGGGAAIGGALGAAHGAATAEEGQRGAGALRGAVKGGLLGLAGGQVATRAGREQVKRVSARQAHALTGYVPRTQAQVARGVGRFGKGMSAGERRAAFQQLAGGKNLSPGMAEAAYRNLTSIPGVAKGLLGPGARGQRLQNLKTVVKAQGAGAPIMMGALGAPAVVAGAQGRDPAAMGEAIGSTAGYVLGTPVPIAGNIAAGSALGAVGKRIGAGIGRLTGVTPKAGTPAPARAPVPAPRPRG